MHYYDFSPPAPIVNASTRSTDQRLSLDRKCLRATCGCKSALCGKLRFRNAALAVCS
jgi:hypothetical protein